MKGIGLSVKLLFSVIAVSMFVSVVIAQDTAINKIHPWVIEKTRDGKQAEFIVKMKAKADLSLALKMKDKESRGQYVYEALLQTANMSQAALRSWLEHCGIEYRWFYTTNALLVKGSWNLVYQIAQREDVESIHGNPQIKNILPLPESAILTSGKFLDELLAIEWNVSKVRAPQVWAMGHRGEGVVVGAQDTGYRWTHTAVRNQYRGWDGTTADHDYNWHDSIHSGGGSCGANSPFPCDDDGHGTHTIGTVLGSDYNPGSGQTCASTTTNQVGVAPCARWIGCRDMDQGDGTPARYIECFDFFLAPYPVGGDPSQGDPTKAPDLTTNSWTCPPSEGCSWNTLQDSVNAHYAAGIMFVVAAGNEGSSCGTVNDPGSIYQNSYTMGSTTSSDAMSGFSSRGPADNTNLMKPNAVTPGSNVRSAYNSSDTAYTTMSGTSMATPCAAGVVALLWSCFPSMKNDIDATRNVFNNTATRLTAIVEGCGGDYVNGPNNTWGYGLLNAEAACNYCTPPAAPTGLNATTPASNTIRLTWNSVSGAAEYKIYRADGTGCPGGTYIQIDTVTAPTTTYDDTTVSGGITYAYVVKASNVCDSPDSNCTQATATGSCTVPPTFAGITSASDNGTSSCGITVSWSAGTSNCPTYPTITYTVYRDTSPGFPPGPSNQLATCLTGASYNDTTVSYGTTYYYIVRAEDSGTAGSGPCNSGNIESNATEASATPTGGTTVIHTTNFESGANGWIHSAADSTCTAGNWYLGDPTLVTDSGVTTQPEDDHTPAPGINAFFTAPNSAPGTDDVDGGVCTALSPVINASAYPRADITVWYFHGQRDAGDDSSDYFRVAISNDGGTTYPTTIVNIGDVTLNAAWTVATTSVNSPSQIRIRVQASDGASTGDLVEGGVDDIVVSGVVSCTTGPAGPPGEALTLNVAKNGANLDFNWTAPGGTCNTADYGLYKGDLSTLTAGYNHNTQLTCSTGGSTSYSISQSDPDIGPTDYYIVTALNSNSEGSYGKDSSGTERPVSTSACESQDLTGC